jgi:hypothetical protein
MSPTIPVAAEIRVIKQPYIGLVPREGDLNDFTPFPLTKIIVIKSHNPSVAVVPGSLS